MKWYNGRNPIARDTFTRKKSKGEMLNLTIMQKISYYLFFCIMSFVIRSECSIWRCLKVARACVCTILILWEMGLPVKIDNNLKHIKGYFISLTDFQTLKFSRYRHKCSRPCLICNIQLMTSGYPWFWASVYAPLNLTSIQK